MTLRDLLLRVDRLPEPARSRIIRWLRFVVGYYRQKAEEVEGG